MSRTPLVSKLNTHQRKWLKWTAGVLIGTVVILLALSWLLPIIFRKQISKKLATSIEKSSKGVYKVSYEDIRVNLLSRSASINNLTLTTDSTVYNQRLSHGDTTAVVGNVAMKRLEVNGISIARFLLRKELRIDQIILLEPDVKLSTQKSKKEDGEKPKSPYLLIQKFAKSIEIENIRIQNGNLQIVNESETNTTSKITHLTLDAYEFLLNEQSEKDSSKILFSNYIDLEVDSMQLPHKDPMYTLLIAGLEVSSKNSTIKIARFHLNPLHPKATFGKQIQLAKDRLDFSYDSIRVEGVNLRRLVEQGEILAKNVFIGSGNMDVYKDKRYPKYIKNRMGTYPHQLLLNVELKIKIDTIHLKKTKVIYGEFSEQTYQRGKIYFDNVHGIITNVTNDSLAIAQNKRLIIDVKTRFMGAGNLLAYFDFDLASNNGDFACGGKMQNFEMKEVNEMIRSLAKANVKSGTLTLLDFTIKGNDHGAYIRMQMHYHDLKIEVLKLDEKSGKFKKRSFISNLINNIIIDNNNPKGDKPARIGEATLDREATQPFFNLIWLSIQEPIKRIVMGKDDRKSK
jgi:hypothetical protein